MTKKEDQKFDLAGWAQMITAIAAVITAVGFSSFLPDLIKHFLLRSPIESVSSVTSTSIGEDLSASSTDRVDVATGINEFSENSSDPSQIEALEAPIMGILSLRQGIPYLEARTILFQAGWEPREYEESYR